MTDHERALSFGTDALAYDRHRPGYPDAVVDAVLEHADGEVGHALEVGAGTGKATVVFAGRGIEVLAVEPDAGMRAVLEGRVATLPVRVVDATFETVDLDDVGPVDLLYAAAAFHWTDPATRWDRVATALRPGGLLALFGARTELADEALVEVVDVVTAGVLDDTPFAGAWTLDDIRARPELTDVVEITLPRRNTTSATDFVAFLSTVSAYRVLPAEQQHDLLTRVCGVLPAEVEIAHDVTLHLARRTPALTSPP